MISKKKKQKPYTAHNVRIYALWNFGDSTISTKGLNSCLAKNRFCYAVRL